MVSALSPPGAGPGSPSQHLVGYTWALEPIGGWREAWGPGLAQARAAHPWVGERLEWEMGSGAILPWELSASVAPCWQLARPFQTTFFSG